MVIESLNNVQAFVAQAIREANPRADVRRGTPVYDFLVQPLTRIYEEIFATIDEVRVRQSLVNLDQLTDDDVDAIVANLFISRRGGSRATGTVRLLFDAPISVTVPAGTVFFSADTTRFIVQSSQSITEPQMSLNVFGELFFFDVEVQAENEGEVGSVGSGEIVSVSGLQIDELAQVTNPSPFTGGVERETNTELVARAAQAITERSLVTSPGAVTILLEQFSFIEGMQPIGYGDPEMIRDVLNGENLSLGGRDYPDAEDVHIGGKVDYYLQIEATSSRTLDMLTTTLRNRLRARDNLDDIGDPEETFQVQGGVITDITEVSGTTVITDTNLSLIVDELIGEQIQFSSGRLRRQRFTVIDNGTDSITLGVSIDAEVGDSFFVVGQVTRPILAIEQIEEIDPVSLNPLGVFLTEGEDYILEFESPPLTLSDLERISILFIQFSAEVESVSLNGFGNTVVEDSNLSMTDDAFIGETVRVVLGGEEFEVIDNTATTFVFAGDVRDSFDVGEEISVLGGSNIGKSWRVTYTTQADISTVQDFLISPQNRVLTADLVAKSALPVFVDMSIQVQGQSPTFSIDTSSLTSTIEDYIRGIDFGGILETSDIVDLIYDSLEAERTDIGVRPFTFDFEYRTPGGDLVSTTGASIRINDRTQVFSPDNIVVTEI